jgi:cysteine desulfurase
VAGPIYMDNHATTAMDVRVLRAMEPYCTQRYGNPGSVSHGFGQQAREAVQQARQSIAAALGAEPSEVVFTSGATESNNLALRGTADRLQGRGRHLVSVATEHKAVLDPLDRLARRGFEVTRLEVAPASSSTPGWLDPDQVARALRDDTILVSVMLANNEIGVIQPLAEIGEICRRRGVWLHCDAAQAVGRVPVDVQALHVDMLSFSGHKMYGPRGMGVLYVRRRNPRVRLVPLIDGGGQEQGLRSGTLNVPGIVGLARALELCLAEMPAEMARLRHLRQRLFDGLTGSVSDVRLNGPGWEVPEQRLPGNLNVSFGGVDGEALMMNMGNLAVSSGSACTSANPEPSHVLRALGIDDDRVRSSLRFGLGRFNTEEDVDRAIAWVTTAVKRLRRLASAV